MQRKLQSLGGHGQRSLLDQFRQAAHPASAMTDDIRAQQRLRFLADTVISLLTVEATEADATNERLPETASIEMLKVLLAHSIPVLQASRYHQIATQIEAALTNPDLQSGG